MDPCRASAGGDASRICCRITPTASSVRLRLMGLMCDAQGFT